MAVMAAATVMAAAMAAATVRAAAVEAEPLLVGTEVALAAGMAPRTGIGYYRSSRQWLWLRC